jgi:hypothetical protein
MANPVCSVCSSVRRPEIDADLVQGMSAMAVAAKYGLTQTTVARHKRNHLKPHLQAIARVVAPVPPPMSAAAVAATIPTVGNLLADLGATVERLKVLADDAEREGGLGMRAVALRELRTGLTDATKLISVLRPPEAPTPDQIDRRAIRDALKSVLTGADAAGTSDSDDLLQRLAG